MCLAIPGKIQTLFKANGVQMGKMNFGGVVRDICLAYVPDIEVGDYAIVHVGFAISKVDEASAKETLRLFQQLGVLDQELGGESNSPIDPACYVDPASHDNSHP